MAEKGIPFLKKFIKSKSYLEKESTVKTVLCVSSPVYNAELYVNGRKYVDAFNDEEPFDRKSHVFYIEKSELKSETQMIFTFNFLRKHGLKCRIAYTYGNPSLADEKELIESYDNELTAISEEKENLYDGVVYRHILYNDKKGAPVHAFLSEIDTEKASVYIGTPDDGYERVKVRATIPEMIDSANKNGKKVITAANADFFDMFGDYHPSGLCVKNGRVVANENSKRPFIGVKKDGTHIITDTVESKGIVNELQQAAAGIQMVLKDGEIFDYAPMEPFSFTRHPRTCVGIKKDGTVLLLVVDGRIPEYSNGASLVDLARLMQSYGADRAINLDGGGSSAMYTRKDGEYILRSRPADLFRPTARLIRKDYNSILIVEND